MIIELPNSPDEQNPPLQLSYFFFPNNNLAIRRVCASELGGYDQSLRASEDVDLCFRLAATQGWVAFRESAAVVRHHPRSRFMDLVRQMCWWGWELGRVYKKTGHRGLYVYYLARPGKVSAFECGLSNKHMPLLAVFLTDFHMLHIALAIAAVAALNAQHLLFLIFLIVGLWFLWRYLQECIALPLSLLQRAKIALIHYCANSALILAAFIGGLRHGLLFIPASIFRPR